MELQLFNKEQALSILNIMIENNYIYGYIHNVNYDEIRLDLNKHKYTCYTKKDKSEILNTFIEIDDVDKTFIFNTKNISFNITDERKKKLNKILKI